MRGGKYKHDYAQVLRVFQELGNQHRVGERLGISQAQVSDILRRMGIRVGRGKRDPIHPLPMDEVASRYLAGESTLDIAPDYNVTAEVIRRRLRSHGIARRSIADSRARGAKNNQWKGGLIPTMHYHRRQSYEVAAICLGQPLQQGFVIHHLDENPKNNRPDNLIVFPSQSLHARFHQQLLKLQRTEKQVDSTQLALEIGGQALPRPPRPIEL